MLTLFVAGLEMVAGHAPRQLPALERVLARGRSDALDEMPWEWLARFAGLDPAAAAVGPVSALGDSQATAGRWLRVEPLGAEVERHGAFRLRARALQVSRDEAEALASAFRETFAGDGLDLVVVTPCRWYLHVAAGQAPAAAWRGFPGPPGPLPARERPAPPEPGLRRLLSETELLFHAHAVNIARRDRMAPVIAGLHPWGGGMLPGGVVDGGYPDDRESPGAGEEPFLAGLRRLVAIGELRSTQCGERGRDGTVAWPVALEDSDAAALERIEDDWVAPALRDLQWGRLGGIRLVTGRQLITLTRTAALRFWQRGWPLGEAG